MISILAFKNTVLLLSFSLFSCGITPTATGSSKENKKSKVVTSSPEGKIVTGANQTEVYLPLLKGKRVGVVANQTSVIFNVKNKPIHIVDSLLLRGVKFQSVFAPEHGFRGKADAGEHIKDGKDATTGLSILSLYGNNKKPSADQLKDIDVMLFDIQDVGVRFYTYISTLHYIMEACAENNIPVIVLDRPNPNGHIVDGPVLEAEFKSFVGMHPIPVLHGMTIGEYAQMINGEKWLANQKVAVLNVIKCKNYSHQKEYSLPIKPSPNLPNDQSINLYPSLCFFEGTDVSVGRGTNQQFQIYGSPEFYGMPYQFTPVSNEGAKIPKNQGKICYGEDLTQASRVNHLELKWLMKAFEVSKDKTNFFNSFFVKLAGTQKLQHQIESGLTIDAIQQSWQSDLNKFKEVRKKYLLYP